MGDATTLPVLSYDRPRRRRRAWILFTVLALLAATPILLYRQPLSEWGEHRWRRWQHTSSFDRAAAMIANGQWFADGADPDRQGKLLTLLAELAPPPSVGLPMDWQPTNPQVLAVTYDDYYNGEALCFLLMDRGSLGRCSVARDGQFPVKYQRAYRIERAEIGRPSSVKLIRTTASRFPTVLDSVVLIDGTENWIRWQAQANALGDGPTLRFDMSPTPQSGSIEGDGPTWYPARAGTTQP